MALPREYLCFTMWYLRCKEFVTLADNGDSRMIKVRPALVVEQRHTPKRAVGLHFDAGDKIILFEDRYRFRLLLLMEVAIKILRKGSCAIANR